MLRNVFCISLVTLFAAAASAQAPKNPSNPLGDKKESPQVGTYKNWAPQKSVKIDFPVEKFTLDNGLTVLLHEDRTVPMVSYHTWYKVGSRDETPGHTGAAHMLEHMMFKGAKKYSGKQFDEILHANGIVNNAFTTNDYTGFYETLPSSKLELIMDMEVDRMASLALKEEDLKSELKVVSEERRYRVDNNPFGLMFENLMALSFKENGYHWPVIGYMKDIEAYDAKTLRMFYDKFYGPNNAILVLSGDFDSARVKKMIQKYYGALPRKVVGQRKTYTEPTQTTRRSVVVKKEVSTPSLILSYQSLPAGHADNYALDLIAAVLGEGSSSRLYDTLVMKNSMATDVSAGNRNLVEGGQFFVSASLRAGGNPTSTLAVIESDVRKLVENGITEKELQKARNQVMMNYISGLDTISDKAQSLAVNEILFGDYKRLFSDLEKYNQVKMADIQRVAKQYLVPSKSSVVTLIPGKNPAPGKGQ
ncbi:MAG: M16 family metallopeptidase [Pseudobdellovibrionaceae bacterium]